MKKSNYLLAFFFAALALVACNEEILLNDLSLNPDELNSTLIVEPAACDPMNVSIWAGTVENHSHSGYFTVSNDGLNLYLNVESYYGFQAVDYNIDIAFYNVLPDVRPDVDGFHYRYTVSPGTTSYSVTIPLNSIFIEDLGDYASLGCGQQINILVHDDIMFDMGGGVSPQSGWAGYIYGPDGQWWKYVPYTICCAPQCTEETAWAAGNKYVSKSNWATYTPFEGISTTVVLFAGQTMNAGTVSFTPEGDNVKISILLNDGWSLQDVDEPVKIQGYFVAPNIVPSPGRFTTYKGDLLEFTVPQYNFYGVHLDVQICE